MSETNTETTLGGAESPADGLSPDSGTSVPDEQESGAERPMPREQRYRLDLRAAERERDALAQRVERMQTREVERLAAGSLSDPADLLALGGVTIADLLNDDGDVDPDKVDAVAREILSTRPGLRNGPVRGFDPSQGLGGREPLAKPKLGWDSLFKD